MRTISATLVLAVGLFAAGMAMADVKGSLPDAPRRALKDWHYAGYVDQAPGWTDNTDCGACTTSPKPVTSPGCTTVMNGWTVSEDDCGSQTPPCDYSCDTPSPCDTTASRDTPCDTPCNTPCEGSSYDSGCEESSYYECEESSATACEIQVPACTPSPVAVATPCASPVAVVIPCASPMPSPCASPKPLCQPSPCAPVHQPCEVKTSCDQGCSQDCNSSFGDSCSSTSCNDNCNDPCSNPCSSGSSSSSNIKIVDIDYTKPVWHK